MTRRAIIITGVLVLAVIGACAGEPRAGSLGLLPADASPRVQRGHQVYITDCASCHRAREPRRYSRERWDAVLPRMEARAKLSPEDARAVEAYVGAALETPAGIGTR